MATIYDSTAAADIPNADDGFVFAYNDGLYSQVGAVRQRFPNARIITISAIGLASADVVDVEPGCVWPVDSAVAYVRRERDAGRRPTVYCGRANWPSVIAAFAEAGMEQPPYWIAHYTNIAHLCSSGCFPSSVGSLVAKATQYGGDLVGHYDVSVTNGAWPDQVAARGSGNAIRLANIGTGLSEEDDLNTEQDKALQQVRNDVSALRKMFETADGGLQQIIRDVGTQLGGFKDPGTNGPEGAAMLGYFVEASRLGSLAMSRGEGLGASIAWLVAQVGQNDDVDPSALAKALAPLLPGLVSQLDAEDYKVVAQAVADEDVRRNA